MADYSREQLMTALRNADAAGDVDGAKRIAVMVQNLDKKVSDDVTGGFEIPQGATNEFGLPQNVYAEILAATSPKGDRRSDARTKKRRLKERERLIKLEQLRISNPWQAENIEDMSALDNVLVGVGSGLTNVGRGVGLVSGSRDDLAMNQLAELSPSGGASVAGEIVGETLPFLPAGVGAGALASKVPALATTAGRIGTGVALGGAEGGIISEGRGEDALRGAGIGAGVALALEAGIPIVGRGLGALYRKLSGKAPKAPLITTSGEPSKELTDLLAQNDIAYEDAIAQAVDSAKGGTQQAAGELDELVEFAGTTAKKPTTKNITTLAAEAEVNPEKLAAAQRLGLSDDLPLSAMSDNPQFQDFEQGLAAIIGSEVGAKQAKAIDAVKNKADELIQEFGGEIDSPLMSSRIRDNVTSARDELFDQANSLYNTLGDAIPGDEVVDVAPLKNVLDGRIATLGNDASELSPVEKALYRFVKEPAEGKTEKVVTYELIDRERKRIGEQLSKKSKPFENATEAELKQYYSVLTDIQGEIADNPIYGVQGVWNEAKDLVSQRKTLEDQMINIFGKEQNKAVIPQLGKSMVAANKDELVKFNSIIESIPVDLRTDAIATALNDVFTQGARNQSQLNMGGFVGWYDKLNRSPGIKKSLLGYLPETDQKRLEDFYEVAKGFQSALSKKTPTGRVQSLLDGFDKPGGMLSKVYNLAPFSGDPTMAAASSLAQTMKGKGKVTVKAKADKLLADPRFKQAVVVALNNPKSQAARRTQKALTQSKEYNQWVTSLPEKIRAEIAAVGFIPWIIGGEDE